MNNCQGAGMYHINWFVLEQIVLLIKHTQRHNYIRYVESGPSMDWYEEPICANFSPSVSWIFPPGLNLASAAEA